MPRASCTHTHAHTHTRTQRRSNTEQLLQTDSFTQTTFYTEHILDTHTQAFNRDRFTLHRGPATQRPLYTEILFTERPFVHTDELLHKDPYIHAEAFTQSRFYTQRRLYRVASTGDPSRHRAGLTHTHTGFYTETLLHRHIQRPFCIRDPFTHRRVCEQSSSYTETLVERRPFYTDPFLQARTFCLQRPRCARKFLHRDPFTYEGFYTETLLNRSSCTETLLGSFRHTRICAEQILHRDPFTQRPFTQSSLDTENSLHRAHFAREGCSGQTFYRCFACAGV